MRILHIEEMFHPYLGYQVNVLTKFQVKQGNEVAILTYRDFYPRVAAVYDEGKIDEYDRQFTEETGVEIFREPVKRFLFKRPLFGKTVYRRIREYDPDIIMCHGNGTFTGIQMLFNRKKLNKPMIYDSHMLELAHRSKLHGIYTRLYRLLIRPIMVKNNLYVIKAQDDPYLNEYHGLPERLTPYLGFGADTDLFYPDPEVKKKLRAERQIGDDEMIFLYTGKTDADKGGKLLAEAVGKKLEAGGKKPRFVIVSDYRSDYEKEVHQMLKESENRVTLLPLQKYKELPAVYQFADVMFFPKQCSLSFFDAQACGLPVILEDIHVNVDRTAHGNGCVFEQGSVEALRERFREYLEMDDETYRQQSQNAANLIREQYSYEDIARAYTDLMKKAIEEYRSREKKARKA